MKFGLCVSFLTLISAVTVLAHSQSTHPRKGQSSASQNRDVATPPSTTGANTDRTPLATYFMSTCFSGLDCEVYDGR